MDLDPLTRDRAALRFRRGRQKPVNLSRKGPASSRFGASTFNVDLVCVLELPDDTEDHLFLTAGQVQALVCYGAYSFVPKDAHRFLIQKWQFSRRIEEVRGMHAEHLRQGNHLFHGRIGQFPFPDLLDVFLGQVSQAQARHFSVGIRSTGRLVLYEIEEPVGLLSDAQVSRHGVDRQPIPEAWTLLEPQLRREVHDLGYGFQLLETRVFDSALPQVGDVRARDDTPRRLIYLLATPPVPVRMTIHLQEGLELLRDVHLSLPPPPRLPFGLIY